MSSACFYPLETEKSLIRAAKTGAKTVEIFMNSDSEFEKPFLDLLCNIKNEYGLRIPSVHTMASLQILIIFSAHMNGAGLKPVIRFLNAISML